MPSGFQMYQPKNCFGMEALQILRGDRILLRLLFLTVCYALVIGTYRLFFHPLAQFPGPRLAALTRLYEAFYDVVQNGQYTFKIAELHKIYGKTIASKYEADLATHH